MAAFTGDNYDECPEGVPICMFYPVLVQILLPSDSTILDVTPLVPSIGACITNLSSKKKQ